MINFAQTSDEQKILFDVRKEFKHKEILEVIDTEITDNYSFYFTKCLGEN